MGKVQNIFIQFNNRCITAGENIKGRVRILLKHELQIFSVKCECSGRSKVKWEDENETRYKDEEIYLVNNVEIFRSRLGTVYQAGTHEIEFDIKTANHLPTSFEGKYGYIRYTMNAIVYDKKDKFSSTAAFAMIHPLDLNKENVFMLQKPLCGNDKRMVDGCCTPGGVVSVNFRMNKQAFVPGEHILIEANLQNGSAQEMGPMRFKLIQIADFFGKSGSLFSSGNQKSKTNSAVLASMNTPLVGKTRNYQWRNSLRIPACPPSRLQGCSIMNVEYKCLFQMQGGNWGDLIQFGGKIIIGTVPMRPLPDPPRAVQQPRSTAQVTRPAASVPPSNGGIDAQNVHLTELPAAAAVLPPPYEEPPPTYEEATSGRVQIPTDCNTDGASYSGPQSIDYAPAYPVYNLKITPMSSNPDNDREMDD